MLPDLLGRFSPLETAKTTFVLEGTMFFTKDIGIDLGTANTLVYMKGKGIIIREPSVVAVDIKNDTVRSVGQAAKDVVGRTPGSIVTVRPLKDEIGRAHV